VNKSGGLAPVAGGSRATRKLDRCGQVEGKQPTLMAPTVTFQVASAGSRPYRKVITGTHDKFADANFRGVRGYTFASRLFSGTIPTL
jgi:hypothetical protein